MAASTRSKTRRLAPKPGPPYLAPELLLNIFLNVSDRKTQLALRSTCKQFRDIMDRYTLHESRNILFSAANEHMPSRFPLILIRIQQKNMQTDLPLSQLHGG